MRLEATLHMTTAVTNPLTVILMILITMLLFKGIITEGLTVHVVSAMLEACSWQSLSRFMPRSQDQMSTTK